MSEYRKLEIILVSKTAGQTLYWQQNGTPFYMQKLYDIATPLSSLLRESRELWVPSDLARVNYPPTSLIFIRDYAMPNLPVVFTNVPVPVWRDEVTLEQIAGDSFVNVGWTPAGYGDYIDNDTGLFVKPHIEPQRMRDFLHDLRTSRDGEAARDSGDTAQRCRYSGICGVPYYSAQDDCLRRQLPHLLDDLPCIDFARDAFGADADAVNLWIGDERSVTSMHKDHYENLFLVVSGEKHFTLRPPCDIVYLQEKTVPSGTYAPDECGFLRPLRDAPSVEVPWIVEDSNKLCCFDKQVVPPDPIEIVVRPGEMLYLPSLWYHEVRQVGFTVAVNWWFDMCYNSPAYVYFNFLRELTCSVSRSS